MDSGDFFQPDLQWKAKTELKGVKIFHLGQKGNVYKFETKESVVVKKINKKET